jgi:hypothetical protein
LPLKQQTQIPKKKNPVLVLDMIKKTATSSQIGDMGGATLRQL